MGTPPAYPTPLWSRPRRSTSPAGAATIPESTSSGATAGGERERSRLGALVRDGDSDASALARVCSVAVDELRMSGAVVSLMTPATTGQDQSGTIAASSSDVARSVEEIEFSVGEGPGTEAFLTSRPVLTPDLEQALARWPGYVPAALETGVRATFAFPLLVGAARFGVLHLHCPEVRALSTDDTATSLLLTALATELVLDVYSPTNGHPVRPDVPLLDPDDHRDEVYQAQGMVTVQLAISLEAALARMRAHAFASDQKLAQVAADILAGRTRLQADPEGAP